MTIFRSKKRKSPPALDLVLYGLGLAVLVLNVLPGTLDGSIALKGAPPLRASSDPLLFYGCLMLLGSAALVSLFRCASAMTDLLERRTAKHSLKEDRQ